MRAKPSPETAMVYPKSINWLHLLAIGANLLA